MVYYPQYEFPDCIYTVSFIRFMLLNWIPLRALRNSLCFVLHYAGREEEGKRVWDLSKWQRTVARVKGWTHSIYLVKFNSYRDYTQEFGVRKLTEIYLNIVNYLLKYSYITTHLYFNYKFFLQFQFTLLKLSKAYVIFPFKYK